MNAIAVLVRRGFPPRIDWNCFIMLGNRTHFVVVVAGCENTNFKAFFTMTFFKKIFRSKNDKSKSRKLEKFDTLNKSDRSIISLISTVYNEDSR